MNDYSDFSLCYIEQEISDTIFTVSLLQRKKIVARVDTDYEPVACYDIAPPPSLTITF